MLLENSFFNQDACKVAKSLIGKVIRRKYKNIWLSAQIIETEAYYLREKSSHSSLGKTDKRLAMFMPAGTIYMYYARGQDSFNISVKGAGNAILLKSATPLADRKLSGQDIRVMQQLNPQKNGRPRTEAKLCAGQTLLCRALNLKVSQWDQHEFNPHELYIDDTGYTPEKILQTTRLGIPVGRDEHKPYRFIDLKHVAQCTSNPLTKRKQQQVSILTL